MRQRARKNCALQQVYLDPTSNNPCNHFNLNKLSFFHIFLTPPSGPLALLLIGGWILRRRKRAQRYWLWSCTVLLYVLATNSVGGSLLQLLEQTPPWSADAPGNAQAIVVLGGGTYFNAPEYGGDTVSAPALERARYAAWLHRRTGLPVLVTGGAPLGNADPEGRQLQRTLQNEFGIPVRWVETRAANTLENARYSADILRPAGISRVLVVSHAWHMPRARLSFADTDLQMIPAPTGFTTRFRLSWLDLLPSAGGLERSRLACHEWVGMLWYRVKLMLGR